MARVARGQKGFTLIELLIVIIIVGILAAIAVPLYLGQRSKAKDARLKGDLHTIVVALENYALDNNDTFPAGGSGTALRTQIGGYFDKWPVNPYAGGDMQEGTTPGSYHYSQGTSSTTYALSGYLSAGIFTVQ